MQSPTLMLPEDPDSLLAPDEKDSKI